MDEASNVNGSGSRIVLITPTGETIRQAIKCHSITNNEAEYEVVIAGLELALEIDINQIELKTDSQLVVNKMLGTYTAREARMQQYLMKAQELVHKFQTWKIMQVPREENLEADALANIASAANTINNDNASTIHLFHSYLDNDKEELNYNHLNWDWINEVITFLQFDTMPTDKNQAHALRKRQPDTV